MIKPCYLYSFLFFIFLLLANISAVYAVITETQSMSFGTFALRNNNAQYNLTINPDGSQIADAQFAIISNGREAAFNVSGFPPSTTLIITVVSDDLTLGGGGIGEGFPVANFKHLPTTVVTDAIGNASFTLGATMTTSGTSNVYADGNYSGNAIVSVNF